MRFSIIGALPMQSPTSNDRSRTGAVAAIDGGSCLQNVGASSTELRSENTMVIQSGNHHR